jgi:hypothetical protein
MSMPNLYSCFVCGLSIDPKSALVLRRAVVWLKSNGQKVYEIESEMHKYRHEFCNPKEQEKLEQLF